MICLGAGGRIKGWGRLFFISLGLAARQLLVFSPEQHSLLVYAPLPLAPLPLSGRLDSFGTPVYGVIWVGSAVKSL